MIPFCENLNLKIVIVNKKIVQVVSYFLQVTLNKYLEYCKIPFFKVKLQKNRFEKGNEKL